MILGSHNSWSFLKPKHWWMKLLSFTAKCQSKDIIDQYLDYNIRCFDLRLKFINGKAHVVHNIVDYGTLENLEWYLSWLNGVKDEVYIRILHDVRIKSDYTKINVSLFKNEVLRLIRTYPNLKFWCGINLYNNEKDFIFEDEPICLEFYSSVCPPKIIDDWIPYLYAKFHNKYLLKIFNQLKSVDGIFLIDYVNIN